MKKSYLTLSLLSVLTIIGSTSLSSSPTIATDTKSEHATVRDIHEFLDVYPDALPRLRTLGIATAKLEEAYTVEEKVNPSYIVIHAWADRLTALNWDDFYKKYAESLFVSAADRLTLHFELKEGDVNTPELLYQRFDAYDLPYKRTDKGFIGTDWKRSHVDKFRVLLKDPEIITSFGKTDPTQALLLPELSLTAYVDSSIVTQINRANIDIRALLSEAANK